MMLLMPQLLPHGIISIQRIHWNNAPIRNHNIAPSRRTGSSHLLHPPKLSFLLRICKLDDEAATGSLYQKHNLCTHQCLTILSQEEKVSKRRKRKQQIRPDLLTGIVVDPWRVLIAAWASAWVANFTKAQPIPGRGNKKDRYSRWDTNNHHWRAGGCLYYATM